MPNQHTSKSTRSSKTTSTSPNWLQRNKGKTLGGAVLLVILLALVWSTLSFFGSAMGVSQGGRAPVPGIASRDVAQSPGVSRGALEKNAEQYATDGAAENAESVADIGERKVIKHGTLAIVVDNAEQSANKVRAVARSLGGYVDNVYVREAGSDTKTGTVTIRVPSRTFDRAMDELKTIATKVTSERIETRDVTNQMIDLEARLETLKATEQEYRRLLEDTDSVEDVLKVRDRLNDVRTEIERLEARREQLSREVNMSTITVNLTSRADVEVLGVIWTPIKEIKAGFHSMLEDLTGFANAVIAFIFRLPVILLWIAFIGVILYAVWRIGRWAWRKITT